ncbi:hypothetical protein NDU88_003175 [Pleurodeles waltl]|uniref:Uncharacterized protein n=1 Tax=Pleurodeles waltl TaxID=8319 RepID=A0AAV7UBC4_PLEWA|nr:hypothetical protein NDU88_003175 [Pleurodeles waltl]
MCGTEVRHPWYCGAASPLLTLTYTLSAHFLDPFPKAEGLLDRTDTAATPARLLRQERYFTMIPPGSAGLKE